MFVLRVYWIKATNEKFTNTYPKPISKHQQNLFKKEDVYQIFPEYYVIRVNKFSNIVRNKIDEWIYFLKNESIKDEFQAKGLDEAKETLDVMNLSPKARELYDRREENKRYKKSLLHSARVEGEYKGRKEEKIEIAKNLLDILDIETISLKTGLSIEMIEELRG